MSDGCNYEDPETDESVVDWLGLSNELYTKIDHGNLTTFQPFKGELDCTVKEGWIQRAFVLSFYYLQRFKDFENQSEINFYEICIKETIQ